MLGQWCDNRATKSVQSRKKKTLWNGSNLAVYWTIIVGQHVVNRTFEYYRKKAHKSFIESIVFLFFDSRKIKILCKSNCKLVSVLFLFCFVLFIWHRNKHSTNYATRQTWMTINLFWCTDMHSLIVVCVCCLFFCCLRRMNSVQSSS